MEYCNLCYVHQTYKHKSRQDNTSVIGLVLCLLQVKLIQIEVFPLAECNLPLG